MVSKDRLNIENRITKMEERVAFVQEEVKMILQNHFPHINKKLNWLILIIVTLAAENRFDILSLLKGIF